MPYRKLRLSGRSQNKNVRGRYVGLGSKSSGPTLRGAGSGLTLTPDLSTGGGMI